MDKSNDANEKNINWVDDRWGIGQVSPIIFQYKNLVKQNEANTSTHQYTVYRSNIMKQKNKIENE